MLISSGKTMKELYEYPRSCGSFPLFCVCHLTAWLPLRFRPFTVHCSCGFCAPNPVLWNIVGYPSVPKGSPVLLSVEKLEALAIPEAGPTVDFFGKSYQLLVYDHGTFSKLGFCLRLYSWESPGITVKFLMWPLTSSLYPVMKNWRPSQKTRYGLLPTGERGAATRTSSTSLLTRLPLTEVEWLLTSGHMTLIWFLASGASFEESRKALYSHHPPIVWPWCFSLRQHPPQCSTIP